MQIRVVEHSSKEYEQIVHLRINQLLEPIGIPASYIEREKEQNDVFIAAFENNEIIGCCILTPKNDAVLQLRQMAVQKEYRGKGIGAAIIEFAEGIARKKHYSVLMMHARDEVIDFYKKCGYEIAGDQFFEVGIPHHKMQKRLS